jgi:hypothetical protein
MVLFVSALLTAAEPLAPGLKEGQRPGPYSSVVSVGEQRGKSHCFICETADRPAVIVFARSLSDQLGKLAVKLDRAVEDNKASELRAWTTFLHADQSALDPQLKQWARTHALRAVPLTVFEDVDGPPSYKLNREADVVVIAYVKQKTVASFAFRPGELTDERIAEILKVVPRLTGK